MATTKPIPNPQHEWYRVNWERFCSYCDCSDKAPEAANPCPRYEDRLADERESKMRKLARINKPLFQTKRLDVFGMTFSREEMGHPRTTFIGVRRDIDLPFPTVTLTVWLEEKNLLVDPGEVYVEMIDVLEQDRHYGFATEMWRGVEAFLEKRLTGSPVTDIGKSFCEAIQRANDEQHKAESIG